jgi:hypothetical protein
MHMYSVANNKDLLNGATATQVLRQGHKRKMGAETGNQLCLVDLLIEVCRVQPAGTAGPCTYWRVEYSTAAQLWL